MQFQPQLETRCLGQITRALLKPEITQGRGHCPKCTHDEKNWNCCLYRQPENRIAIRLFEVGPKPTTYEQIKERVKTYISRVFSYLYHK